MIVNMHDYENTEALIKEFGGDWLYVGRANRSKALRESPLANRWSHYNSNRTIQVATRGAAIQFYRKWLWGRIQEKDRAVLRELRRAYGKKLVCWCVPKACHGAVVKRAAEWLHDYEAQNGKLD